MEAYPWYEIVDGDRPLRQGDIVLNCPVVTPRQTTLTQGQKVDAKVDEYTVVVMTQSCDLENRKVELVAVCPVWDLNKLEDRSGHLKDKRGKEDLRKGNIIGYHLLNKSEIKGFETDYLVVDFQSVYGVRFDFVCELCKSQKARLSLLPPYREQLSQAFARFFMRVGLPVDIPPFNK